MNRVTIIFSLLLLLRSAGVAQTDLDSRIYHLRSFEPREWSEFPEKAFGTELVITFKYSALEQMHSLRIRQQDVKQNWIIALNGHQLGTLVQDEADILTFFNIEKEKFVEGDNTLRIYSEEKPADDIRVGQFILYNKEVSEVLDEASISFQVVDENGDSTPAHLTIVNEKRILQPVLTSTEFLTVRPGHIYTNTGGGVVRLPEGIYTIFAGRGFEYSIDSATVHLTKSSNVNLTFKIKREVNTQGWISCDPHVHTATHSGHGDASDQDRVITLAGEGIELPIITDHNQHVDLNKVADNSDVNKYFTLVTGNEVTTKVGHFNLFPLQVSDSVVNFTVSSWPALRQAIAKYAQAKKTIILNHARDIHNGFRPHDPSRFLEIAGQRLDGQSMFANAMEVINSGSQQSNRMQLFNDWMHLLNGGYKITPVGSSDSHDVSRFIVGQGRTYIKANDSHADSIDVNEAVDNLLAGKVMISCGLLTAIKLNNQFGPGDTAPGAEEVTADIEVSGPSWAKADKIVLYINGERFKEENITDKNIGGVKWKATWQLPKSKHDYYVVVIAEGPGNKMVFWPIAKPYQPTSPDWTPHVIGASGAVWVDADGNGKRESANDYAQSLITSAKDDIGKIIQMLNTYDESVAIQVAAILHLRKFDLHSSKVQNALRKGSGQTRSGFEKVLKELSLPK